MYYTNLFFVEQPPTRWDLGGGMVVDGEPVLDDITGCLATVVMAVVMVVVRGGY